MIQGFIPADRAPSVYTYKIMDHPFVIRFIPQTIIDEVFENAPVINLQKFMLLKFHPLQALANTNLELLGLFYLNVWYFIVYSLYVMDAKSINSIWFLT